MDTRPIIFNATEACRAAFQECRRMERLMVNEWAENRLADFNLWASGIGASARHRASLDARLLLNEEVRDTVYKFLMILHITLKQCKVLASETPPKEPRPTRGRRQETLSPPDSQRRLPSPFSDDSDTSSADSSGTNGDDDSTVASLNEVTRDVDLMLSRLVKIGVNIRDAGNRSRLQKADNRFEPDDHLELRQYLETLLLSQGPYGESYTFHSVPLDPSKLGEIQQRLVDANLRRRNRFIYAQKHSGKLNIRPRSLEQPREVSQAQAPISEAPLDSKDQDKSSTTLTLAASPDPASKLEVIEGVAVSTKTGTTASGITQLDALKISSASPSIAATTQVSQTVGKLHYPRPPGGKDDKLAFRCPCCCQVLPAMLREETRWRKHLSQDLYPYTCFLPNCPNPQRLFRTKQLWNSHLMEDHFTKEYWVCYACIHSPIFETEGDLASHTLNEHADAIADRQIPLLMKTARRCTPAEINACPICNWPRHEMVQVEEQAIVDHIAEHIHDFSLLSLPWAPDEDLDDRGRNQRSVALVSAWLSGTDRLDVRESFPEDRKRPSDGTHYFHQNDYFAESAISSRNQSEGSRAASVSTTRQALEKMREEVSLSFSDDESGAQTTSKVVTELGKLVLDSQVDRLAERKQRDPDDQLDRLEELMEELSVRNYNGHRFLPAGIISQLVTPEMIRSVPAGAIADLKRLFLILFKMNRASRIPDLLKLGITDAALPVTFRPIDYNGKRMLAVESSLRNFEYRWNSLRWQARTLRDLVKYQWEFLAPVFGGETFYSEFEDQRIMPYLKMEPWRYGGTVFDTEFEAEIHKEHLHKSFWPNGLETEPLRINVRINVRKVSGEPAFVDRMEEKLKGLQQVHKYKSDYLVKPIAAYRQAGFVYLVSPWVDRHTLESEWANTDHGDIVPRKITRYVAGFLGISLSLKGIHEADGELSIYGGLVPEVILVSGETTFDSTFHLGEIGIAALAEEVESEQLDEETIPGRRYYAPEMNRQHTPRPLGTCASDMWAFGRILLEHLVWSISGYEALVLFRSREGVVPRYADHYIHWLGENMEDCAYRDILCLISTKLLVPEEERINARWLASELSDLWRRCQNEQCTSYVVTIQLEYPEDLLEMPDWQAPPPTSQDREMTTEQARASLREPLRPKI